MLSSTVTPTLAAKSAPRVTSKTLLTTELKVCRHYMTPLWVARMITRTDKALEARKNVLTMTREVRMSMVMRRAGPVVMARMRVARRPAAKTLNP